METNGHNEDQGARLDRLVGIVEALTGSVQYLFTSQKQLLTAQVILTEQVQNVTNNQAKTDSTMRELALAQKQTEEKLNALIAVVDGWIRKPEPPAPGVA